MTATELSAVLRATQRPLPPRFYRLLEHSRTTTPPFDPDPTPRRSMPRPTPNDPAKPRRSSTNRSPTALAPTTQRCHTMRILECQRNACSYWGMDMTWTSTRFVLRLYVRGKGVGQRTLRRGALVSLQDVRRRRSISRLVIVLQAAAAQAVGQRPDTRSIFLKLFKDIPNADMEMLVPGARLQMPKLERGKLGVSIVSGLCLVGYQLVRPCSSRQSVSSPLGRSAHCLALRLRLSAVLRLPVSLKHLQSQAHAEPLLSKSRQQLPASIIACSTRPRNRKAAKRSWRTSFPAAKGRRRWHDGRQLDDASKSTCTSTPASKSISKSATPCASWRPLGSPRNDNGTVSPDSSYRRLATLDAMPSHAIFTREMMNDEPLDLGAGPRDRDVGRAKDLRAGPQPQGPSRPEHRPAALPGARAGQSCRQGAIEAGTTATRSRRASPNCGQDQGLARQAISATPTARSSSPAAPAAACCCAVFATVDPGDEVIVFDPYFVGYPPMISLAGEAGRHRHLSGLSARRGPRRRRDHAAHEGDPVQHAVQPDGCRVASGGRSRVGRPR